MIRVIITEPSKVTEKTFEFKHQAVSNLYLMGFVLQDGSFKHMFTGATAEVRSEEV